MGSREMGAAMRGVIFDMDGVLLDSEPLHHQAVNAILAEEQATLEFADYVPYMGTTDEYTWSDLIRRFDLRKPYASYLERYDSAILELYRSSSVIAPGARWLLDELMLRGLGLAVASSSRRDWVETCLTALHIEACFNIIVTGDMVKQSKPNPEIFLLAARCLGLPPRQCLAIEDSPNGVAAAVAAGMVTIAVDSTYPTLDETQHAHVRLHSLADFDYSLLEGEAASVQQQSEE